MAVKKILQFGMTDNVGGMETYLMMQYRHIDRNKLRYDFVYLDNGNPMVFCDEILQNGDRIYPVIMRRISPIKHYFQMAKLIFSVRHEYHAVVLNACSLYYVFPLFIAFLAGIPHRILHSHNSNDEIPRNFVRSLLVALNRLLADCSVTDRWACSEMAGRWMFGKKNFTVIHNAIQLKPFAYDSRIRKEKRMELGLADAVVIGHVGRFSYQKNHEFLVLIFFEITQLCPDAKLLLIGDAVETDQYLQNTKNLVREYGLEDKVLFLGKRMDVNQLMQAMDCFVLPSRFEGLPLVGIEAQAAGLPCVVSDVVTKELDVSGSIRFVSLQEDVLVWANAIVEAVQGGRRDNVDMIKQQGYDIEASVKKIEQFFCEKV